MRKYLQNRFIHLINELDSVDDFIQEIISDVDEWPMVEVTNIFDDEYDDEMEESTMETLYTDNISVIEILEDSILICVGSDLQEPRQVKISFDKKENILFAEIIDEGWSDGLSENEFLSQLFEIELDTTEYTEMINIIRNKFKIS